MLKMFTLVFINLVSTVQVGGEADTIILQIILSKILIMYL